MVWYREKHGRVSFNMKRSWNIGITSPESSFSCLFSAGFCQHSKHHFFFKSRDAPISTSVLLLNTESTCDSSQFSPMQADDWEQALVSLEEVRNGCPRLGSFSTAPWLCQGRISTRSWMASFITYYILGISCTMMRVTWFMFAIIVGWDGDTTNWYQIVRVGGWWGAWGW